MTDVTDSAHSAAQALKAAALYQSNVIAAETAARIAAEREAERVRMEESRKKAGLVRAQEIADTAGRLLSQTVSREPFATQARAILQTAFKEARMDAVNWDDEKTNAAVGEFSGTIKMRVTDWRDWWDVHTKTLGIIRCKSMPGAGSTFSFAVFTTIGAKVSLTGVQVAAVPTPNAEADAQPAAVEVSFTDPEWPNKLRDGLRKVAGVSPALKAGWSPEA